ncbi:hypothetical protein [Pseudorhizobium flavum]|uniref:hypothetical protein n=1 Tax=Pseudorhizobium flavum TaxID=1335061 RepID=UPI00376F5C9F
MTQYHPLRFPGVRTLIDQKEKEIEEALALTARKTYHLSEEHCKEANRLYATEGMSRRDQERLFQRQRILFEVHELWKSEGRRIFDVSELQVPEAFDLDDVQHLEFTLPSNNLYIHFGQEAALFTRHDPTSFFDGVYLRATSRNNIEGLSATFVCGELSPPDACSSYSGLRTLSSRIAAGWSSSEESLSYGLRSRGLWGDEALLDDPIMPTVIDLADDWLRKICAAEQTIAFRHPGVRH